jgi:type II secretory pathway component PulL
VESGYQQTQSTCSRVSEQPRMARKDKDKKANRHAPQVPRVSDSVTAKEQALDDMEAAGQPGADLSPFTPAIDEQNGVSVEAFDEEDEGAATGPDADPDLEVLAFALHFAGGCQNKI